MYSVHYKKTHTSINVKKRSNHPQSMKRAIIKGFADRARALCDERHLAEQLHNIEDVFVANGYPRETVKRFMKQRPQQRGKKEQEEQESRVVVTIPYLKGLSEQFRRSANRHFFELLSNLEERLKRLSARIRSRSVKGKNALCVRFLVPARTLCMLEKHGVFTKQGKKEHMDKVRLTNEDLHKGNTLSAENG